MSEIIPSINKVLLSGKIGTVPQLQKLSNQTHLCYSSLSVLEKWTSSDGKPMERNNWFKIETLGRHAQESFNSVKRGEWYFIDGYLRHEKYSKGEEDKSIVKVRAFSIIPLKPTGLISINKVLLSGKVGTVPQLQRLSNQTYLCYFSLSVLERWTSSDGKPMERGNWFKVEVLGRNAQEAFNTVKKGEWYFIDGYLRYEKYSKGEEDKSIVKVRAFSVVPLSLNSGAIYCDEDQGNF